MVMLHSRGIWSRGNRWNLECRDFQIAISYRSLARGNSSAYCARCDAAFEQDNGIWLGLPKRRLAYYAQFIEASEQSGEEAGGPGSDPESYLALPFHDSKQIAARRRMIRAKTFRLIQTKILNRLISLGILHTLFKTQKLGS